MAQTPVISRFASSTTSQTPPAADVDLDDAVNSLDIAALTLDVPVANAPVVKKAKPKPFPFMQLPVEIRLKIYAHHFGQIGPVVDIEHGNYARIHRRLVIFRVCRQIYEEASYAFYSSKVFRIFPIDGRQSKVKKGLLAKVKPQSRALMTTLELRVGPGWGKPYLSWVVNDLLGLSDCVNVRRLHVYIEIDPSDKIFTGYRKFSGFYEKFCQDLLDKILKGIPTVEKVQFDAHPSVKKKGDMARGLLETATANQRTICWGPCRGWTDAEEEPDYREPVLLSTLTASDSSHIESSPIAGIVQEVRA